MIPLYPFSSPVIMTDMLYETYGGHLDNSTYAQRQAAFTIAEMALTEDIGTLLTRTRVTGTYLYQSEIMLDYSNIHNIVLVRFIDFDETIYYTVSGTGNEYIAIRNKDYGLVDINAWYSRYCSHNYLLTPYQVQIVYETGLISGTSYQPNILLGLTVYSEIILNEMVGYGNEAPGDIGVQNYQNQQYAENRVAMLRTSYGASARANFVHKLLTPYRKYRHVGLGNPIR